MKRKIQILSILFLMIFTACEDFLQENPKSFAAPENYFGSEQGIEQVINGIYNSGRPFYMGRYYVMMFGITTDEISYMGGTSSRKEMEAYTFIPTNSDLARCWKTNVFGINRANMVIEGVPDESREKDFGKRAVAEAKFLRAWFYFSQVRAYGPVPLITKYEGADFFPQNSTIEDIYEVIINDLKDAEQDLPKWTNISEDEKGRASRGAAKSLLAWVYLTRATSEVAESGDMENAKLKCIDVIDNEGYELWDTYIDAFNPLNDNGKEDIFSFQCEANTFIANSIHTDFSPKPDIFGQNGYRNFNLTDDLYNTFDEEDERLKSIFKGDYQILTDNKTYKTPGNRAFTQKYADYTNRNRNNHSTNLPFIRYSNVLLMYAEALNELNGPSSDAYDALNMVRERSDLLPVSGLTKEEFRQEVRNERYREFHGEGIRWFDLVRWGILKERVETVKSGVAVNLPKHQYFPIPQSEMDANRNLIQNQGY